MLSGDVLTITAQPLDETLVTLEYNSGGIRESASLTLFVENGPGETDIVLSATDIAGLSVSDTVHVTVASVPSGIFGLPKTISELSLALSVYATDLDGDDDVDVLGTGYHTDGILWWENDGNQVFTEHNLEGDAEQVHSAYAADLDGDGDMDIIEAGHKIEWFENEGTQDFTEHIIESDFSGAISVYATDVDGDGNIDILGAGNNITWFENEITQEGTQGFTEHTIATWFDCQYSNTCGGARDVYAADVDGDGDVDILGATYNAQVPYNNYNIIWWENDGSENFTEHIIDDDFSGASSVYATDVDGDGDVDILGAARGSDEITWWQNDGNENFIEHTIDNNFDGAYDVYATDLDGDGDVDILGAAQNADDIVWWENDGSQDFTRNNITMPYYQLDGARSVYATDVDGDGDIDVLGAAGDYGIDGPENGSITWWENTGNIPPEVTTALPDVTIAEDTYSAIIVPTMGEHFTDANQEDILSYTASALGAGLDSLSISSGLIVYPTENFAGYVDIMVIATDTYGASVADTLVLTIENINDAPVVITALPDVTIDEDNFGTIIISALEDYFNDIDQGDSLSFLGNVLGEGLDSLSISSGESFAASGSMTNDNHAQVTTSSRRSRLVRGSNKNDFPVQQTLRDKSVQQNIIFGNSDTETMNPHRNISTSRTDPTPLIVYPTENFVGNIEIVVIASDLAGESVADTMMLTIVDYRPTISSLTDVPQDQGGQMKIQWAPGYMDEPDYITQFSIWREVPTDTADLWDFITTVPWIGSEENYSRIVPTLGDSTVDTTYYSTFRVTAHTEDVDLYHDSEPVTGYSIDNLHPTAPQGLIAVQNGASVILQWFTPIDEDFNYHNVYRENLDTIDSAVVFTTVDSFFVDLDIPTGSWQYYVTAVDSSGNESDPSETVSVILSSDLEPLIPTEFALHQNYPNPFNPTTQIRYDLPEDTYVRITIFDIMGRKVRSLINTNEDAGYRYMNWDATNDLGQPVSAGMYIYTIQAGEFRKTKKMVLLK
jgi:hypothetical protein